MGSDRAASQMGEHSTFLSASTLWLFIRSSNTFHSKEVNVIPIPQGDGRLAIKNLIKSGYLETIGSFYYLPAGMWRYYAGRWDFMMCENIIKTGRIVGDRHSENCAKRNLTQPLWGVSHCGPNMAVSVVVETTDEAFHCFVCACECVNICGGCKKSALQCL